MLSERSGSRLHGAKIDAVDVDDDERDALARGAVELLVRVQQPLRRGRGERPDAGPRRRDHVAEHRVLALEVRELDVVAARDELGEPLDDQRLRRDRVAADRLGAREHDRVGRGLVRRSARRRPRGRRPLTLGTSSIAIALRTGQTTSQMPQPLQ